MFIAHAVEEDIGCGHTISCGEKMFKLDATTRETAIRELKLKITGQFNEFQLGKVMLFEVLSEEEMPIVQWHKEAEELREHTEKKRRREEYERLKGEFGEGGAEGDMDHSIKKRDVAEKILMGHGHLSAERITATDMIEQFESLTPDQYEEWKTKLGIRETQERNPQ